MPMTKEEKREYMKEWREANKERNRLYNKEWREKNKEKIKEARDTNKEYIKEYRELNRDKLNDYYKKYKQNNNEKLKEYQTKYTNSAIGKKNNIISSWINGHKIKFDDKNEAEFYYKNYINATNCSWCDKKFKNSFDRHLDHCHTCGVPRAIICSYCNTRDLVPCVNCLL